MKSTVLFLATLLTATAPILAGQCHFVDNYGIYQICDPPPDQHQEHHEAAVQTVYVPIPTVLATPVPTVMTPVAPDPGSLRTPADVEDQMHRLHILLDGKVDRGEIGASFYNEETRYLTQIEQREEAEANANNGYLTVDQENALLQQLTQVENEIYQQSANS